MSDVIVLEALRFDAVGTEDLYHPSIDLGNAYNGIDIRVLLHPPSPPPLLPTAHPWHPPSRPRLLPACPTRRRTARG